MDSKFTAESNSFLMNQSLTIYHQLIIQTKTIIKKCQTFSHCDIVNKFDHRRQLPFQRFSFSILCMMLEHWNAGTFSSFYFQKYLKCISSCTLVSFDILSFIRTLCVTHAMAIFLIFKSSYWLNVCFHFK